MSAGTERASLAAFVVWPHRPFGLGVGRPLRRHRDELAAAVLNGGVFQLNVLTLRIERDAWPSADIFRDVGRADGVGQGFRVGRLGALVSVSSNEQRLECIDVVGVHVDAWILL